MLGNILITGGASGLGRATAEAVAKAGGRPLVIDVNAPDLEVEHVLADLSDRAQAERAVAELAERAAGWTASSPPRASTPAGAWPTSPPTGGSGWCRSTCSAPSRWSARRCRT
nr:hypothetical protein GCM10020093_005410 [Planobispora longispora]